MEEWGGISYALSGSRRGAGDDWEIVPLIKVGDDLAARATQFLATLERIAPDARVIDVPYPNNRVELRYYRRRAAQRNPHRRRARVELAGTQTACSTRRGSTRCTSTF